MSEKYKKGDSELIDNDEYFRVFEEYSKTVKGWFIAYGIGAPVLFLTQEKVSEKIIESGEAKLIVLLFLSGVVIQVFIALVNKWNNWYIYLKYDNSKEYNHQGMLVTFCCKLSRQVWIDILIDILSFCLFFFATAKVLMIFAK